MAKQRWKRTLSLILSAAMIWGMSGMPAFAEEPTAPVVESEVPPVSDSVPQPEEKVCACDPQVESEGAHTSPECPFYKEPQPEEKVCTCASQVEGEGEHTNSECPFYKKDEVSTENEETKALIEKLPSLEEYHQWRPTLEPPPENEGYQAAYDEAVAAHCKEVEEQVKAAREAYDLMTEEQKAAFDPALTAKLTTWETKLSQPVTDMEGRLSSLPSVEEFQNWKPTLTIPETAPSYQAAYDEAVAAHRKEVEDQVNAVREAYGALSEAERAVLAPALVEKLTALEGILTPVMAAYNNEKEFDISQGSLTLTEEPGECPGHIVTGKTSKNKIDVQSGTHTITLSNVNISMDNFIDNKSAMDVKSGANVTLILEGTNRLKSDTNHPAIWVPSGASLTIQDKGSLVADAREATLSNGAAGIGGGHDASCGNITIASGVVEAYGGGGGAGIGGGYDTSVVGGTQGGNITITGGWVKAYGGYFGFSAGAGIGAGENASFNGTITINGGVVYAKGGGNNAASIGGGGHLGGTVSHGTFSTGTNGDAVIVAPDGIGGRGEEPSWNAIVLENAGDDASASLNGGSVSLNNNTFQVLGEVTPDYNISVASGTTLNVNANDRNHQSAKLIMKDGTAITNNGDIRVQDASVLELHNHKACGGSGTITVADTARVRVDLTEDMISLPQGSYPYTGSAIEQIPTVKLDNLWTRDRTYIKDTDYTVSYENNVNVGTAQVKVTPKDGNRLLGSDAVIKNFTITAGDYTVTVPTGWSIMEGCSDLIIGSRLPTASSSVPGKLTWYSDKDCTKQLTNDFVQDKKSGNTVPAYWKFTPYDSTNYPSKTGTTTLQIVAYRVHEASIWNDKNTNITEQAIQKAYGEGPFNVNAKIDTGSGGTPKAPKSQVTWNSSDPDVATVARNSGTFDEQAKVTIKGVGTTTITATIAEYQGSVADNYAKVSTSFTLTVTPKGIFVEETSVKATERAYDGTRDIEVTADLQADSILAGDKVTLTAKGLVDIPHAGDNKTVHVTYTLDGSDAENYVLTNSPETKVNITKAGWDGNNITVTGGEYKLIVQNHRKQTYNVSLQNINPEISDATGNKLSLGNVTYEKGSVSIKKEGYFAEGDLKIVASSTLQVPVNYVNSSVEDTVATVSITVKSQNFTDYTGTLTVVSTNDGMNKITATAGEGGTISPSGDIYVVTGDKQEFKVQANEGYEIQSVKVDGTEQIQTRATDMSTFSYIFDQVKENHTIKATFKKLPTPPTPGPDEPGNGGSGRPGSSSGGSSTYDPQAKDPDRVQVSLEARKLLDGKTPGKQEFTFTLTDEKGKVVRTAENKGGKIVFDSLALLPGTYRYTMEEVNGSGGSAFGYDDTVYEAEIFVYTSGGKYTAMVSYYQDGKELDELPAFRNTTAPAAPGTDKENPITGGGPAFPAALTAMVSLGAIAFLWRKRS